MPEIAAILIGRNEGARLVASLASLGDAFARVIYVDSGSTDGSVDAARAAGTEVVELDTSVPFTAARARNAGIEALQTENAPDLVQFIDGDCALEPGWVEEAVAFLADHPDIAVVCGRRREIHPDASVYNRLCDAEWNTPVGEAAACGGDALIRWVALEEVGGYDPTLIAGEEPEMCLRMQRKGWRIWRLDVEMTRHDAAMTQFDQFWARMRRSGHAAAEGAAMYGADAERHGVATQRRALLWGVAVPVIIGGATLLLGPVVLWLLAVYPAQVTRLAFRDGGGRLAWERAVFLTVGKFAEASGVLSYYWGRSTGRQATLIEYK